MDGAYQPAPAPTRLGRYELLGQLAVGGMAEIYLARLSGEGGFAKTVVVKRLLPQLVASAGFVAMFLDEGKLVARLDHPNICEVFDLGRDGSDYFIAMPYLDGVSAAELIGRVTPALAAAIVAQACAGLHYAHELRGDDGAPSHLVHRDVSPSNLFVTAAGAVKVLDFGIAKIAGATAETDAGMVKGKSQYMAPEQVLGRPLDRRCDVFSLGIVLFELATGRRLFDRDSDYLAARAILEEPIARADQVEPSVPKGLADVIARCLARDPMERPQTAHALAEELEAAIGRLTAPTEIAAALASAVPGEMAAHRTRQATVLAEAPPAADSALATRPRVRDGRARRRWYAGGAIAAVGAAATVFALHASSADTGDDVPPTIAAATTVPVPSITAAPRPIAPPPTTDPPPDPPPDSPPDSPQPEIEMAPTSMAPARPGRISIDSQPWAKIAIDGVDHGATPLLGVTLAAGRHRVHAVTADGRTTDVAITIPSGKSASPLVLHW